MSDESYLKSLKLNKDLTKKYYESSLKKTYQQIFLEQKILPKIMERGFDPRIIADVACGGGTLTYHISKIFTNAKFILIDINDESIDLAKIINKDNQRAEFIVGDFLKTEIPEESVDIVFCMQTLLAIKHPKKFLEKIIKITRKGGYFILSSLFNLDHDVDIFCKVRDFHRKGRIKLNYNTFSKKTISNWLKGKVEFFDIIPFEMPVELPKQGRGLGSYTLKLEDGGFITISGGILLQWGFLYGKK